MRLATFRYGGQVRLGVVDGEHVVDLNRAYARLLAARGEERAAALAAAYTPPDIVGFLAAGDQGLAAANEALASVAGGGDGGSLEREGMRLPLSAVALLPVIPHPGKFLCVGRNYKEHAEETGSAAPTTPVLFARYATSLVAAGQPVIRPKVSDQLDWEGELAVIIGRRCRHVAPERALEMVAGYSLFNDVSVRDYQYRGQQFTAGKNFEGSGPFGPYLVTKDEVPDPHMLDLETTVNGERMQQSNTSKMIFDIPTLIAHITEWTILEPGDVIATGTPSGVGFARKPPRFLKAGDTVSVTITNVGTLMNPVIDEA
jgi:2-keto-4-pentenoate hydratase/2-oxohepta-3-ene-1,7-dioic acid hydratase in catechol pathway